LAASSILFLLLPKLEIRTRPERVVLVVSFTWLLFLPLELDLLAGTRQRKHLLSWRYTASVHTKDASALNTMTKPTKKISEPSLGAGVFVACRTVLELRRSTPHRSVWWAVTATGSKPE
jgi:hypothetical protein